MGMGMNVCHAQERLRVAELGQDGRGANDADVVVGTAQALAAENQFLNNVDKYNVSLKTTNKQW